MDTTTTTSLQVSAKQVNPTTSPLVSLHYDALHLIIDLLTFHDKFMLSHTCRKLRSITFCNWQLELKRLPAETRLEFWTQRAYNLPSKWVCASCCKLHPVMPPDSASKFWRNCYSVTCSRDAPAKIIASGYPPIYHHYVQLALKYSRLRINHTILEKLLAPSFDKTKSDCPSSCDGTYLRACKIIDNRFLVKEQWSQGDEQNYASRQTITSNFRRFCPHIATLAGYDNTSPKVQVDVAAAFAMPGYEATGGCHHCLTDYSILVTRNECTTVCLITTWRDFGTETCPDNLIWKSQVTHGGINDGWNAYGIFHREMGSVRKLFMCDWVA
ncbi:hypothetical protein B0I35DRAFT_406597 [Stachybotrys elegans]|uniref:F-box domain-containing protein n=1 Tax=Stachybotrys elegans TaxID=80388 RepID=A0A8K0SZM0_9HYPO|nr:hypothetical protein B0I35DRAFT_406597 [Stachybotrys elegans]